MAKGKKSKRDSRMSTGAHKLAKINLQVRRIKMKIKRWERYQQEIEDGTREGKKSRWNTSGLEKHLSLLEGLL